MSAKSENENGGLGARKGSSETDTVDVASLLVDDDEDPSGSGQWWGRSIRTPLPLFPAKATLHTAPQYIEQQRFPPLERALDFKPFQSTPERIAKR